MVEPTAGPGYEPAGPDHPRADADAMAMVGRDSQYSVTPNDSISQTELARYYAARTRLKQLEEELEAQRQDFIGRIDDGAPIEPGQFQVQLRKFSQKLITATSLGQVLSPDELESLRDLVPPKHFTQLHVTWKK
jgi:hypothetical protein